VKQRFDFFDALHAFSPIPPVAEVSFSMLSTFVLIAQDAIEEYRMMTVDCLSKTT
jgi:hypothetical protein